MDNRESRRRKRLAGYVSSASTHHSVSYKSSLVREGRPFTTTQFQHVTLLMCRRGDREHNCNEYSFEKRQGTQDEAKIICQSIDTDWLSRSCLQAGRPPSIATRGWQTVLQATAKRYLTKSQPLKTKPLKALLGASNWRFLWTGLDQFAYIPKMGSRRCPERPRSSLALLLLDVLGMFSGGLHVVNTAVAQFCCLVRSL